MATSPPSAKTVFDEAIEIASPEERRAYLDRVCIDAPDLRQKVEALLAAYHQAGSFLEVPAAAPGETVTQAPATEQPGTVIGPYKLIEQIGEGGMGTVWMAQQTEPVKRLVAVKLIKAGMDSKTVIARFEAERQALALMDHPNIARVLDGGTTGASRPYFVMDLVKGVPITKYCDEHRLTPRQRLELFVPVCQAVQHAHQKGIIHRDLKPSNVLVAQYDGRPVPKVIDFGVAKAAGQQLTEQTLVTGFGNVVGTLEYMSPEQAELNQLDIDTRSDIYSLGVVLYELLTGSTPLDRKRLKQAAFAEILRVIREEEPPKPSTRLSNSTDSLPSVAARRQIEPAKLRKLVRGELDWIVMKALEKDRNRRYETANGFAMDVQRYLADEPVQACPPSMWYRLRKTARRNKVWLSAAACLSLALALVAAGLGWFVGDRAARRAKLAEDFRAAETEAVASLQNENWPRAEAAVQRAAGLLAGAGGNEALQQRLKRLQRDLDLVAALELARLQQANNVKDGHFDNLGARPAYVAAFRDYDLPVLDLDPDEAAARIAASAIRDHLLAALLDWHHFEEDSGERRKLAVLLRLKDADPWGQRVFEAIDQHDGAGLARLAQQPEALRQPPTRLVQFAQYLAKTDIRSAVEFLRQAQQRHPSDFWINHWLAFNLCRMNPPRDDEAIGYYRVAVALHRHSPGAYLNLGLALKKMGSLAEAIAANRESIRLKPDYADAHINLGNALNQDGKQDEAIIAYKEAIRLNPRNARAFSNLGRTLSAQHKFDEAVAACRKAVQLRPDAHWAHFDLGVVLSDKGDLDAAIAAFRESIRLKPDDAEAHGNLVNALHRRGKPDEAIIAYKEAIRLCSKDARALSDLGRTLAAQGKFDEAVAACREAVRLQPSAHWAHFNLGKVLFDKGDLDDAITAFKEAIRLDPNDAWAHNELGRALHRKNRLDEAIAAHKEAIRLQPNEVWFQANLGYTLYLMNRPDDSIAVCEAIIRLKPDRAEPYDIMGKALYSKGSYDKAVAAEKEAVRLNPNYEDAQFWLGRSLWAVGREEEAIAATEKATRLASNWAWPRELLAEMLTICNEAKFRDHRRALKLAKEVVERAPESGHAWNTLGIAQYRAGNWEAARAALEKALELQHRNSYVWFFLAMTHWRLDRKSDARELFDQAVQWMEKNDPKDKRLLRYRAEAEELLAIKEKK
jgi:tetratricopeptide (TPR) repeat protein